MSRRLDDQTSPETNSMLALRPSRGRLPLYFQLESLLRERIRSGQYSPSAPFPTEDALRKEFSVSRGTIRAALQALHRDGLIARHPGLGTFVRDPLSRRTLRFTGSVEELIAEGARTDFVVLECAAGAANPQEATELKIPGDGHVLRITGLRRRGEEVLAHVVVSVPATLGVLLGLRQGQTYPPIASLLVRQLGQTIQEARQVIDVVTADRTISRALRVPIGSPLLRIRRTYFTVDGAAVEFAISCYPADKYQYETTIST